MYSLWFRCSRGSAEYHRLCRRAGFPPGPMTPSECANWPVTNAASLISFDRDGSMVNRVSQLLRYGMVVHTDYSGKQSPEVMLRMWARGLAKHGVSIPLAKIRFFRACDKSQLCLKVIADGKACPDHAFCGVLERLPLHHQKELRARRPHGRPKRSLASRACRQAAYDSQREYLQEHAASLSTWNSCLRWVLVFSIRTQVARFLWLALRPKSALLTTTSTTTTTTTTRFRRSRMFLLEPCAHLGRHSASAKAWLTRQLRRFGFGRPNKTSCNRTWSPSRTRRFFR